MEQLARLRNTTCQTCGYVCRDEGEYHPYVFCVLVRAGQDPWESARELARDLGPFADWVHPPLARQVQRERELR